MRNEHPSASWVGLTFLVVLVAPLVMSAASAADITKANNATDLNDTASWVGGGVPGSGDVAVWDSTVSSANSVGLGSNLDWSGIKIADPGGAVTITAGNTLSLGSSGIDLSAATADLEIASGVALSASQNWAAAAGRTITISGVMTGSSGLAISGGVSVLNMTSNTFLTTTNQTLFTNATLNNLVGASGTMAGAWVATSSGQGYLLNNNGSTANYWLEVKDGSFIKGVQVVLTQVGNDIAARAQAAKYTASPPAGLGFDFNTGGTGGTVATSPTANGYGVASTTLDFSAVGTVLLSNVNTFTGPIAVNSGVLRAGTASVDGVGGAFGLDSAITIANAAAAGLNLAGFSTQIGSLAGGGALGGYVALGTGTLTVGGDNTSTTYGGVISGGGGLVKIGTGTLTLSSDRNSYAGTTTISAGALEVTGRLGEGLYSPAIAIGGELHINTASAQTLSGSLTGSGMLRKSAAGTLTLSGINSYTGGTVINAGLVKVGSASGSNGGPLGAENSAASAVTIASGATLDIGLPSGAGLFYGMTISGSGTDGQGALINTGANGNTSHRQTPNITLSADATIGGSGNILMVNAGYAANSLDLAGNTLTKTGANTFFLNNTTVSAGSIVISQGTLSQFANAANASAAAITLANASGVTLNLNNLGLQVGSLAGGGASGGNVSLGTGILTLGGRNESTSFAGVISGGGGVTKTGTGTQTFAGANTYSGGTTINAGTLLAGNADAFGTSGAISVGASGTLGVGDGVTFTRPFSLAAGGRVRTGNGSSVALPSVAALAAWESQSAAGDETLAEILDASGSTTPTALTSAWTANPGGYFSDILTLDGTGAGNTFVLSMEYTGASDSPNIWYRANVSDSFVPLGTSFAGNVPWTSSFTTPGQYGVDTSAGTVWVVTDHNSQFVVVPEPATLGLTAVWLAGALRYLRRRGA